MSKLEDLIARTRARVLGRRILITHNPSKPRVGPFWSHSDNLMQCICDKAMPSGCNCSGGAFFKPKVGDVIYEGRKIGECTDIKFRYPEMQDIIFNGRKIGEVDKNAPNFSLKVASMIGKSIRESRREASPFLKGTTHKGSFGIPMPDGGRRSPGFATGGFVHGPLKGKDEVAAWLTGEWEKPMSYNYREQRPNIFTDDGQRMFLKVRDNAKALLAKSGAATMEKLVSELSGDSWHHMACVDRLVELNELREVHNSLSSAGQHRLFIAPL